MEQKRTRKIVISCVVILAVACVVVGILVVSGVGVSLLWPFNRTTEVSVATEVEVATEAPVSAGETAVPTSESDLPEEVVQSMHTIETQVSRLRGITAQDSIAWELISEQDLEEIVRDDFFADYSDEDALLDAQVLASLGLLPPDFDLKTFYNALYSEQIAGFYDDEEKAMYVVQGTGFGGYEKMTYAHEYTHFLQDQRYDLENGLMLNEDACEADSERCAAVQALIEGDATLSEILWFQNYATRDDYQDYLDMMDSYESPVFDSAPPYMAADLYFPYDYGLTFVQQLYNQGGYSMVDDAFGAVPVSTEQILHPERYPDDLPAAVDLPDLTETLGGNWYLYDQNVMGEWYTFLILNKAYDAAFQLPEETAAAAAEGWGGDAYAFYLNPDTDEVVFVMDTVWDTPEDADEFAAAFIDYASLRWDLGATSSIRSWTGVDGTVAFWQDGDRTVWVAAPTFEMVSAILSGLE
ncbi:MAG: hypothetical protein H0S79_06820 [Anaerolineaceae bacterium]|nr:hypothetical protein [Anaerolineaceae bacterium]